MSRLDDIIQNIKDEAIAEHKGWQGSDYVAKPDIKALMLELIDDMEQRETEDMTLSSWSTEDYKAFGRNGLRAELRNKVQDL